MTPEEIAADPNPYFPLVPGNQWVQQNEEDFAQPGISIPRDPYPGMVYRQEFYLREAEDAAQVISIAASASVGAAECEGTCLQTLEFTPIEPSVAEHKFYAPGVGPILEVDLENGDRTELVSYTVFTP